MNTLGKTFKWVKHLNRIFRKEHDCSFIDFFYPSIFDHYHFEANAIIGEPYDVSMKELSKFITVCNQYGLTFSIQGGSKWNSGSCFTITVEQIDPTESG